MITNDGKELISKYLLGQVPTYATHLSIGCGATPLALADTTPNSIYGKQRMDFEMTRVPISSKGFVDDSATYIVNHKQLTSNVVTLTTTTNHDITAGETVIVSGVTTALNGQHRVTATTSNTFSYSLVATDIAYSNVSPNGSVIVTRTKLSLTAELPTDNRYQITEVGIWSAASNSLATQYDSRMIFNFSQSWQVHGDSISDPPLNTNIGYNGSTTTTAIQDTHAVFYANTNDPLFQIDQRLSRKEGPRYLNRTLMVRGNLSTISPSAGGSWNSTKLKDNWVGTGTHIHLNNISFDISGNNTSDLLKLAYSLVDKNALAMGNVDNVKILMEFYKTEINTTSGFAKAQIYVPGSAFITDRYHVSSFEISQVLDHTNESGDLSKPYTKFYTSPDFSSPDIRICRIFVHITETSETAGSHYLALDGFRIDNTTENPTYKMSGYSIIKNDGTPITKQANTNNYIDFRFALGVG
jgi:hypothetical protein